APRAASPDSPCPRDSRRSPQASRPASAPRRSFARNAPFSRRARRTRCIRSRSEALSCRFARRSPTRHAGFPGLPARSARRSARAAHGFAIRAYRAVQDCCRAPGPSGRETETVASGHAGRSDPQPPVSLRRTLPRTCHQQAHSWARGRSGPFQFLGPEGLAMRTVATHLRPRQHDLKPKVRFNLFAQALQRLPEKLFHLAAAETDHVRVSLLTPRLVEMLLAGLMHQIQLIHQAAFLRSEERRVGKE